MRRLLAQNLTDGVLPTWRHGRCWWGRFHAEWCVFCHPKLHVGFEKGGHVDDGTGIAFRLALLFFSVYVSFDCARLFGRPWNYLRERHLSASWHDGAIWLELWTGDDDWVRDRPWHRNTVSLDVVRWIVGRENFTWEKGESFEVLIPLPEGCYKAIFTPSVKTWRNRFRTLVKRGHDIKIPGGIPFEGKGENSWDCGEDGLYGTGCGESVEEGIGHVVTTVLESRKRYGGSFVHRDRRPVLAESK